MMVKRANEHNEEEELREAFRVFDKNGDGFIRVSELRFEISRNSSFSERIILIDDLDIR